MRTVHKTAPVTVKALADGEAAGTFEALVSVFGVTDSDGDVVEPGAFAKTLAEGPKPIVWTHDWLTPPIGQTLEASETDEGLLVKGRLFVAADEDHQVARQVYAAMRAGALTEFSWGGRVTKETRQEHDDGTVTYSLDEVDLVEYGPCLKGANPDTRLIGVKSENVTIDGFGVLAKATLDDLDTLRSLIGARVQITIEKSVLPASQLPFAPLDHAWDAAAAKGRVHADAKRDDGGYDPAKLAKAYLWRDDDKPADQVTSYRFIVADLIDGDLTYVPKAIFAAAYVLQGARGGTTVSADGQAALKKGVAALYGRMRQKFGADQVGPPPWEKSDEPETVKTDDPAEAAVTGDVDEPAVEPAVEAAPSLSRTRVDLDLNVRRLAA